MFLLARTIRLDQGGKCTSLANLLANSSLVERGGLGWAREDPIGVRRHRFRAQIFFIVSAVSMRLLADEMDGQRHRSLHH